MTVARTSGSVVLLLVSLSVLAPSARATTGGDAHIDWIGWHAETRTLWWRDRAGGECGDECPSAHWSLARADAAPVRRELTGAERRTLRQTASTVRARPLRARAGDAFTVEPTVTARAWTRVTPDLPGTIRLDLAVHVRERRDDGAAREADARLVAYRSRSVRIVATAQIPGESETLVVLRYTGIPFESGYQDETIAILR